MEAEEETRTFECPVCQRRYMRKTVFLRHAKNSHPELKNPEKVESIVVEKRFQCSICGNKFYHEHILRRHVNKHNEDLVKKETFPCNLCQRTFASIGNLRRHVDKMHIPDLEEGVIIEEVDGLALDHDAETP
jgi:uncharacterized Zn-finger protein